MSQRFAGTMDGKGPGGGRWENAFLFNKILERIPSSPRMLDYVCHITNNQPRLSEQSLMIQTADNPFNNFHLRKDNDVQIREDVRRLSRRISAPPTVVLDGRPPCCPLRNSPRD